MDVRLRLRYQSTSAEQVSLIDRFSERKRIGKRLIKPAVGLVWLERLNETSSVVSPYTLSLHER